MYGYYHPLYARHLMHEYAAEREALRELIGPAPTAHEPSGTHATASKWVAAVATLVIGITALGALAFQDSLATDQSSKSTGTCTVGGHKVRSFAPCPPVI